MFCPIWTDNMIWGCWPLFGTGWLTHLQIKLKLVKLHQHTLNEVIYHTSKCQNFGKFLWETVAFTRAIFCPIWSEADDLCHLRVWVAGSRQQHYGCKFQSLTKNYDVFMNKNFQYKTNTYMIKQDCNVNICNGLLNHQNYCFLIPNTFYIKKKC